MLETITKFGRKAVKILKGLDTGQMLKLVGSLVMLGGGIAVAASSMNASDDENLLTVGDILQKDPELLEAADVVEETDIPETVEEDQDE